MFMFGDIVSSDMGILCTQYTLRHKAEQTYTAYNISGRLEPEIEVQESMQPVVIDVECDVITEGVLDKLETIFGWLYNAGRGILIDERQPARYREAVVYGKIKTVMECDEMATIIIPFLCSALCYNTENEPIDCTTSGITITNSGTVYSEPIFRLYHKGKTGIVNLSVSSASSTQTIMLDLSNSEILYHYIILDARKQIAYYGDNNQSILANTAFPIPYLDVGENTISWDNDLFANVQVQKNERFI